MIVNKKLDRLKQWAGERMGGEVKTNTTDHFKALEQEMDLRQAGMEKMQESMSGYVKAVSKRSDLEKKEKLLPIANLGSSMITHGEDFEHDSEFGQCLTSMGRTQERLARAQEAYTSAATSTWLESVERSLVQMKEYQAARKKLESRRLAYDTSLAKMQKAKREDFRVEEELRSQQAKYEEAEADVERRMWDIKDAEAESVSDLTAFLEAQLAYHDRCREALLQLHNEWPAANALGQSRGGRGAARARSNTVQSYASTHSQRDEPPVPELRPSIRSQRTTSQNHIENGAGAGAGIYDAPRPAFLRSSTQQSPQGRRDISPMHAPAMARVPSDSVVVQGIRSNLRKVDTTHQQDVFGDETSSPDNYFSTRNFSPSGGGTTTPNGAKKAPPPPPPSRALKPGMKAAPPPPPVKRTLIT